MRIQSKQTESLRFEASLPISPIITDVSKNFGGKGEYSSPTDLLAVSLLNCILSVIGIKGKSMGLHLEGLSGSIEKTMDERGKFTAFSIQVRMDEAIDEKTKEQLERVALHCPVYEALNPNLKKEMVFSWNLKSP